MLYVYVDVTYNTAINKELFGFIIKTLDQEKN